MTRQLGLEPGDRVTLTINATVTKLVGDVLSYSYPMTGGTTAFGETLLGSGAVAIDHVAPANWPPQAGDLWRDCEDSLWFVFEGQKADELLMTCNYEVQEPPASVLQEWSPLTLVRREGQDEPAAKNQHAATADGDTWELVDTYTLPNGEQDLIARRIMTGAPDQYRGFRRGATGWRQMCTVWSNATVAMTGMSPATIQASMRVSSEELELFLNEAVGVAS